MSRARWSAHEKVATPGRITPLADRLLSRALHPVLRLVHRLGFEGAEHLPDKGAFLLVSNHPPSLGTAELAAFMAAYVHRFGSSRPLAGFAHATSFGWWPLSWVFRQIGAIPSTYEAAAAALAQGVPIAVFPGGDHEAFRPFWEASQVDFGGRLGFLRIARRAWVPIVPMGIAGVTAPLLLRSTLLASLFVWPRLSGVKRYALSVAAVIGAAAIFVCVPVSWPARISLAWLWAASPLALASWFPARITIRVGTPLAPDELFGDRSVPEDDVTLARALERVEAAVQSVLTPNGAAPPRAPA